jgi:pimeloyl-ACP methyl ester carboxylesterase
MSVKFAFAVAAVAVFGACSSEAWADTVVPAKNVVLVHGAWADGSSWGAVIAKLQAAGLHVTAVQNPLTTVEESVAETKRIIDQQEGPTVLAGHSWGGTVVSEAGADPKVSAMVYVAARAPDAGEDFVALSAKFPTMPVRAGILNQDGWTTISEQAYLDDFANGVPHAKAEELYAEQQPTRASLFAGKITAAGWHNKPVFYAVAKQDLTINPDLERFLAKRMNATTIEVDGGHLIMVSHADEIADLILKAAGRK